MHTVALFQPHVINTENTTVIKPDLCIESFVARFHIEFSEHRLVVFATRLLNEGPAL